jgi:hypothetical protein
LGRVVGTNRMDVVVVGSDSGQTWVIIVGYSDKRIREGGTGQWMVNICSQ